MVNMVGGSHERGHGSGRGRRLATRAPDYANFMTIVFCLVFFFSSTVSHRLTICFICFLSLISVHVAVDSHILWFLSVLPRTSLHASFQVSFSVALTMSMESSVISSRASNLFLTAQLNSSFIYLDFSW